MFVADVCPGETLWIKVGIKFDKTNILIKIDSLSDDVFDLEIILVENQTNWEYRPVVDYSPMDGLYSLQTTSLYTTSLYLLQI